MQKEARTAAMTVDKIIHIAETFKGFKKQPSVLKELDGKYRDAGLELKKEGKNGAELVKELLEAV